MNPDFISSILLDGLMAAIAATNCDAPITITGAECVRKSYPSFWADYEALGGIITRTEEAQP